jgi:hypothetical protein
LMADELSRAEALARGMRRAERAKMRALTSRFTRHIYAVKKYRYTTRPTTRHAHDTTRTRPDQRCGCLTR